MPLEAIKVPPPLVKPEGLIGRTVNPINFPCTGPFD